jgi:hypothetical protein
VVMRVAHRHWCASRSVTSISRMVRAIVRLQSISRRTTSIVRTIDLRLDRLHGGE